MDRQQGRAPRTHHLPLAAGRAAGKPRRRTSGFFVTIWIATVMFKSNDILCKQTALKRERKITVLTSHDASSKRNTTILARNIHHLGERYNGAPNCYGCQMFTLLMYYKNNIGRSYRRQGQMLTIVEYFLLLYCALLPTPVWYRFFLNKEYGSLFSSLTTGLYLTFKLTSVVEKIGKGWCVAAKERTSCFCARKKDAKDL
uniref:Uncharacterized protein n=1 Tax=Zea mays TaxID=4577 RepID=A0A804UFC7_MAIZE